LVKAYGAPVSLGLQVNTPELPWSRILAVALGLLGAVLYVSVDPFGVLPGPVAAVLASVPVTLLLRGLSGLSWTRCIGPGVGAGIGLAIGQYLG